MKYRMILAMLAAMMFAAVCAQAEERGAYAYSVGADGTACLTEYTGSEKAIEIPAEIDGYKVSGIGAMFLGSGSTVETITTAEGIERLEIAGSAFVLSNQLERFIAADGTIVSAGACAFNGVKSLESVEGAFERIGMYAFSDCTGLKTFEMKEGSATAELGIECFAGCGALAACAFPAETKVSIGAGAFRNCGALERFEATVSGIEAGAFAGCGALRKVRLYGCGEKFEISNGTFNGCKQLERLSLPAEVKGIEADALSEIGGAEMMVVEGSAAEKIAAERGGRYGYWTAEAGTAEIYNVVLEIEFKANRLLNKKGAAVYVNGVKTRELAHGESAEIVIKAAEGECAVTVKADDGESEAEERFNVSKDTKAMIAISAGRDGIEITRFRTTALKAEADLGAAEADATEAVTESAEVPAVEEERADEDEAADEAVEDVSEEADAESAAEEAAEEAEAEEEIAENGAEEIAEDAAEEEQADADDAADEAAEDVSEEAESGLEVTIEPAVHEVLMKKGSKGEDVRAVQKALIELGYLSGKADGDFGKKTRQAVIDFQKASGLEETGEITEVELELLKIER